MESSLLVVLAAGAALHATPGGPEVARLTRATAVELQELGDDWVAVRTDPDLRTCTRPHGAIARLDLHVRRADLQPVLTTPVFVDGGEGSYAILAPGLRVVDGGVEGRWLGRGRLRVDVDVPADAIGVAYAPSPFDVDEVLDLVSVSGLHAVDDGVFAVRGPVPVDVVGERGTLRHPCATVAGVAGTRVEPATRGRVSSRLVRYGVDVVTADRWGSVTWPDGTLAGKPVHMTSIELATGFVCGERFCGSLPGSGAGTTERLVACVDPMSWSPAMLEKADVSDDLRLVRAGRWVRTAPDDLVDGAMVASWMYVTEVARRDGWVHVRTVPKLPDLPFRGHILGGFVLDLWVRVEDLALPAEAPTRGRADGFLDWDGWLHAIFEPGAALFWEDGRPAGVAEAGAAFPANSMSLGSVECALVNPDALLGGLYVCAAPEEVRLGELEAVERR